MNKDKTIKADEIVEMIYTNLPYETKEQMETVVNDYLYKKCVSDTKVESVTLDEALNVLKAVIEPKVLDRIAVGARLYDALRWPDCCVNFDCILKSEKETKDILIKESDLMRLIQLVNVAQLDRNIMIVKG